MSKKASDFALLFRHPQNSSHSCANENGETLCVAAQAFIVRGQVSLKTAIVAAFAGVAGVLRGGLSLVTVCISFVGFLIIIFLI